MARAWSVASASFGQAICRPVVAGTGVPFGVFLSSLECGGSVRWRGLPVSGLPVSLRHDIRACQKYADACARIAARVADAKTRDDLLSLQRQ
jgi:hypothetical protein